MNKLICARLIAASALMLGTSTTFASDTGYSLSLSQTAISGGISALSLDQIGDLDSSFLAQSQQQQQQQQQQNGRPREILTFNMPFNGMDSAVFVVSGEGFIC